jgi:hypothetical protein
MVSVCVSQWLLFWIPSSTIWGAERERAMGRFLSKWSLSVKGPWQDN